MSVVVGQHPPNECICYGIFSTQNLKFLLWIVVDPRFLTLLVGQHPFNFYIASNFVNLPVALNFVCCGLMPMYIPLLLSMPISIHIKHFVSKKSTYPVVQHPKISVSAVV